MGWGTILMFGILPMFLKGPTHVYAVIDDGFNAR